MSATRKSTNKVLMGLYWMALFLSMAGFCVVLGGLAAIQHKANTMVHDPKLDPIYISIFTQGNAIPYPNNPAWQFGMQWWLFFFQVFTGLIGIFVGFRQHTLYRAKSVLGPLWAVCASWMFITIEQLLFFSRNAIAKQVWGKTLLQVNLVGVMMVCIANLLCIIFIGLIEDPDYVTKHEFAQYTGANVHNNGSPIKPGQDTVVVQTPV